jgi:nucleoside-diphosphate-sugar epimerase
LQAAEQGDLHVVVLRPAGIYGPGDMRFHKIFKMVRKGRFFILGRGETLYHAVYIDDLVDAFLLAADRPVESGSIYIIAGEAFLSMNDFVNQIADAVDGRRWIPHFPVTPFRWLGALTEGVCVPLGIDPPIHRRRVEFFTKNRAFRIDKAKQELGYAPKVSMAEGLARTAAWYRAEGLL